jgi:hypothetical protein
MHALISALAFSLYIAVCGSIDPPQKMESKRILETAPKRPQNLHVHESDYAWSGWQLVCCIRSTPLGQAFDTTCTVHRYYLK